MGPIPAHIFWPGFCIALLSLSVGTGVSSIVAANSDGGAEIVKEGSMDEQLLDHGSHAWDVQVESVASGTDGQPAAVQLVVRDADGEPLSGLEGRVELRSPAKAGRLDDSPLASVAGEPGVYRAELEIGRRGVWDFVVTLEAGGEKMTTRIRETL